MNAGSGIGVGSDTCDMVALDEMQPRRDRMLRVAVVIALIGGALLGIWYVQSTIPRQIVLASGVKDASYHLDAERYAANLARSGVTVTERMTGGAGERHTPR